MDMEHFYFANPLAFWVFPILIAIAIWKGIRRKDDRGYLQYSSISFLKNLPVSWRVRAIPMVDAFKYLAAAICIFALARPQISTTKELRNQEGIDILLTLDISDSMLIEDMSPTNRMEAAKIVLSDFVKLRPNDRLGLVVFMGEAYTRVPLTLDHQLLLKQIQELQPSRNIKMGTAIGSALALSVGRIKDSTAKSKVIVLATDGENNSGTIDPNTALELAKQYGIKVYTIGMGRDGDAQLPVYGVDLFGRKVKRYQPMHSKVNDELLGRMAQETGGKYFRAVQSNNLISAFGDIDRLEKTKIESKISTRSQDVYQHFLIWGVLFYLVSMLLAGTILRKTT